MINVNSIKAYLLLYNVWRAMIDIHDIGCVAIYVPKSQIRKVEALMNEKGNPTVRYSVRELSSPLKFKKYHYAFTRN